MEVILLERVVKLGQMGDVVNVKNGFARNFLLPQGKALRASAANIKQFESQRAQLETRNLEAKSEAEAAAARLNGQQFVIIRSASEAGALYGSVAPRDIAIAAHEDGFTFDRNQVVLSRPIKELGLHDVSIVLHPEVEATITINVARSADEAEIQSSGKTMQDVRAAEQAEADFDIAELFDDLGGAANEDFDPILDAPADDSEQPR